MLYPLNWMSANNLATPTCVQSLPSMVRTWPRASDLVIVPSMSDITIGTLCFQRKSFAETKALPLLTLNCKSFSPGLSDRHLSCSDVSRSVLKWLSCCVFTVSVSMSEITEEALEAGDCGSVRVSSDMDSSSAKSSELRIRMLPCRSLSTSAFMSTSSPNSSISSCRITASESWMFWSLLLYPCMSSMMSPLASTLDGMFFLVSLLEIFFARSNDEAVPAFRILEGECSSSAESDCVDGTDALKLSLAPSPMSRYSGSSAGYAMVGSLDLGLLPGELTGLITGDVCRSGGMYPSVSNTKNASPPSPSFIGRSVTSPFTMNSTFFCEGLRSWNLPNRT
ncbi:hypothetical protein OGATHE_002301 [Ogataea polymorpha]|uniref:Uncharacterized protein n=1 Tax=Ogataea polymorpha TaxID=460523 RepID=A0A9P8PJ29_9ASCO|nr:hypothetical protein OGATHE_002301 [Ogataea polymorpha]